MTEKNPRQETKKQLNAYVHYSGLGFQMMALIGGGAYGGYLLDQKFGMKTPWWTIAGSFLGITLSFVALFKGIKKLNQDDSSNN